MWLKGLCVCCCCCSPTMYHSWWRSQALWLLRLQCVARQHASQSNVAAAATLWTTSLLNPDWRDMHCLASVPRMFSLLKTFLSVHVSTFSAFLLNVYCAVSYTLTWCWLLSILRQMCKLKSHQQTGKHTIIESHIICYFLSLITFSGDVEHEH